MADRKRPERRQRRNRTDLGLVPAHVAVVAVPDAPASWLKVTREQWAAFWGSDLARVAEVAEVATDTPALLRLFSLYDERERSSRAFRRQRFVEGSQGQPRLNPLAKHLVDLEAMIVRLEDRFGLTPLARLRLGVEFAHAHRSLDEINRGFEVDLADESDPRLEVIDGGTAS